MGNYEPNSHRYKEEQASPATGKKKVEKVVMGVAKSQKKNEIKKLTDVFVSEDIANVKSYIIMDVLIPATKKAISDIVTNGINMILYGDTSSKKTPGSKVSYRSFYEKDSDRTVGMGRTRVGYEYDDIVLDNRGDAEEVLTRMDEIIATYGTASVADLYDLVGITGKFTDCDFGWVDIHSAKVVPVRGSYLLKLPRALPI